MNAEIFPPVVLEDNFHPLLLNQKLEDLKVAGKTLKEALEKELQAAGYTLDKAASGLTLHIEGNAWICADDLRRIQEKGKNAIIKSKKGVTLAWIAQGTLSDDADMVTAENALLIQHSWDLLELNKYLLHELDQTENHGKISDKAVIDGNVRLGKGSEILPGVYIEGNVWIGDHCKIGPNCYLRGPCTIGDYCRIGNAVEIKSSLIMDEVNVGHLSYVGDSIIDQGSNFGAGTIIANYRHDGKNHQSLINGQLVDTGRRKFGAIIGAHVHTGINTSIYPGRKLWPKTSTLPGEIVKTDIQG